MIESLTCVYEKNVIVQEIKSQKMKWNASINSFQIMLLDFGATREYSKDFMDQYVRILKAACDSDRVTVLDVSKDLGFLTGYESKVSSCSGIP